MKDYEFWLKIENLKPINFYRYTSGVSCRVLSQSFNYKTEEHEFLENLGNQLKEIISKQVSWDNKVVIECAITNKAYNHKNISNIFIGCYDGNWSVGFGVWSDKWVTPKPLNND